MREAEKENPAAGETARGAMGSCNGLDHTTAPRRSAKPSLTVSWGGGDAASTATFQGREAQALEQAVEQAQSLSVQEKGGAKAV